MTTMGNMTFSSTLFQMTWLQTMEQRGWTCNGFQDWILCGCFGTFHRTQFGNNSFESHQDNKCDVRNLNNNIKIIFKLYIKSSTYYIWLPTNYLYMWSKKDYFMCIIKEFLVLVTLFFMRQRGLNLLLHLPHENLSFTVVF